MCEITPKQEAKQEPVAWISHDVLTGKDYYGKLPIQSLQPGVYKHTPLYDHARPGKCAERASWSNICHKLRQQLAEAERQLTEISRLAKFHAERIDALELGKQVAERQRDAWQLQVGKVLSTIPVGSVLRASGTIGDTVNYFKELHERIADLERQRDEYKADAERYRFIRAEAYETVIPHGAFLNGSRTAWITRLHTGATFDAAIDAGLAAKKGDQ